MCISSPFSTWPWKFFIVFPCRECLYLEPRLLLFGDLVLDSGDSGDAKTRKTQLKPPPMKSRPGTNSILIFAQISDSLHILSRSL